MIVRDYRGDEAGEICRLFYETVHSVNLRDYSSERVQAWAPALPDPEAWHGRMPGRHTLVVEGGDEVVGFAELEEDGHLDMFFVRSNVVGRRGGSLLYAAVEERARRLGIGRIFTEASIV